MSTEVDRRSTFRARDGQGFTLVELLVVIVILGTLSGVVVFAVGKLTSTSGATACAADARVITEAEEAYAAQHGQYATEAALVTAGQLKGASTMHDVTLSGGNYDIVAVGQCIDPGSIAAGGSGGSGAGGAGTGVGVKLLSSGGAGLAGAQVEYFSGSWLSLGSTASDGLAASGVADGTYQFRVDYRGQTQTLPATAVTAGTPLVIHTVSVGVNLTGGAGDHSGAAIDHQGNDGFWMTDDSTDAAGTSALELLPGTYTFRADFRGETNLSAPTGVLGPTTASFPLTTVTVGAGEANDPVDHRANNGEWIGDGVSNAGKTVTFDVLAGDYTFRAHRQDASTPQVDKTVSGATTSVNVP